jgi:hypothetical protein
MLHVVSSLVAAFAGQPAAAAVLLNCLSIVLHVCVQAADPSAGLRPRYVLPEQLTPHHVHALLSDLRASAAQVGGYGSSCCWQLQYLLLKRLLCMRCCQTCAPQLHR